MKRLLVQIIIIIIIVTFVKRAMIDRGAQIILIHKTISHTAELKRGSYGPYQRLELKSWVESHELLD